MKSYAWEFHRRRHREPRNLVTYTGANGQRVTREEYFAQFKPASELATAQPLNLPLPVALGDH